MTDIEKLRIALARMGAAEGEHAVDKLVRDCAGAAATNRERRLVKPLTHINKVGDVLALEVLAKVGWLCNDGKEKA